MCLAAAVVGPGLWQYDAWQDPACGLGDRPDLSSKPVPAWRRDRTRRRLPRGPGWGNPSPSRGHPRLPEGTSYVLWTRPRGAPPAYWVVTPLDTAGSPDDPAPSSVPRVRGWSADSSDQAPAAPTGAGEARRLAEALRGFRGEPDDDPTDDVFPQLRVADLVQRVDSDLYGAYAVLRPDDGSAVNDAAQGLAPACQLDLVAAPRRPDGSPLCATCSTRSSSNRRVRRLRLGPALRLREAGRASRSRPGHEPSRVET